MRTALLFAGQATQYVGMGRHLYDGFPEAREIFHEANDALGERLSDLIFEGPSATLDRTENTQPAVLTVGCAGWSVLRARGFEPTVVAGHSLGEYGALVAAEVIQFKDAIRLCRQRGIMMQNAVPAGEGAMAAIQKLGDDVVSAVCKSTRGLCQVAVYNTQKGVVISGERDAVASACTHLTEMGGVITPLRVSAPFHCPMVAPAGQQLAEALAEVSFSALKRPYVTNVGAEWVSSADERSIKLSLVKQVSAPVLWRQSLEVMLAAGIERFWQMGPGRSNLSHVKRLSRRVRCHSMDRAKDIDVILGSIQ